MLRAGWRAGGVLVAGRGMESFGGPGACERVLGAVHGSLLNHYVADVRFLCRTPIGHARSVIVTRP